MLYHIPYLEQSWRKKICLAVKGLKIESSPVSWRNSGGVTEDRGKILFWRKVGRVWRPQSGWLGNSG